MTGCWQWTCASTRQGAHAWALHVEFTKSWLRSGQTYQVLSLILNVGAHFGVAVPDGPVCGPCVATIAAAATPTTRAID